MSVSEAHLLQLGFLSFKVPWFGVTNTLDTVQNIMNEVRRDVANTHAYPGLQASSSTMMEAVPYKYHDLYKCWLPGSRTGVCTLCIASQPESSTC